MCGDGRRSRREGKNTCTRTHVCTHAHRHTGTHAQVHTHAHAHAHTFCLTWVSSAICASSSSISARALSQTPYQKSNLQLMCANMCILHSHTHTHSHTHAHLRQFGGTFPALFFKSRNVRPRPVDKVCELSLLFLKFMREFLGLKDKEKEKKRKREEKKQRER